jgi:protein gp37
LGDKTEIAWTNFTWNPWQGCHKVSDGCQHCYMFRDKRRYGQDPENVHRSSPATFNAPLKWSKALAPGETKLVFTCSWSDFFIKEADEWRDDAWQIIRQTPNLIYQILTKRPQRIVKCLPSDWGTGYPNVWLGVTAENQVEADRRIPILVQIPAAKRFLSCEPLLGPLDLSAYLPTGLIHQVIVGGESGPNFREMHPDWARNLRDQCQAAVIPFFFKQWSGNKPSSLGHLLDGKEYREFPL